jgi:hypothetical protein
MLIESHIQDILQIFVEENLILAIEFTEKEIYDATMQMKINKAPGPDGFPSEFYQLFWGDYKRGRCEHVCNASSRRTTSFPS